jgi:hypothetical protein
MSVPDSAASQPQVPTHRTLQLLDQQELNLLSSMSQCDNSARHLAVQEHNKLLCARKEALQARAETLSVKQKGNVVSVIGCEVRRQGLDEPELLLEMDDDVAMVGVDTKYQKEKHEQKATDVEIQVANPVHRQEEDFDIIACLKAQLEQFEKINSELKAEKEKNQFLEAQILDKDEEISCLEKQMERSLSYVDRNDSGIFGV